MFFEINNFENHLSDLLISESKVSIKVLQRFIEGQKLSRI